MFSRGPCEAKCSPLHMASRGMNPSSHRKSPNFMIVLLHRP